MATPKGTLGVFFPVPPNADVVPDEKDLCKDPLIFDGRGRETDPHVTLHFGLPRDIDTIRKALKDVQPFEVTIGGGWATHTNKNFQEDGKDHAWKVIGLKVKGDKLQAAHAALVATTGVKWQYPEYSPHMTIAYLKADVKIEPYIEQAERVRKTVVVDHVIVKAYKDKTYAPVVILLGGAAK